MFEHKKILIVLPKRLGDAIFYTPAIAFLKRNYPTCQIDVIALTKIAQSVFTHNPAIHKILFHSHTINYVALGEHYDYLLQLYYHRKSLKEITDRVGACCYKAEKHLDPIPSAEHCLHFLSELTGRPIMPADRHYHLYPIAEDVRVAGQLLANHAVRPEDLLIMMHVGCHGITKKTFRFWTTRLIHKKVWPIHCFIALAQLIQAEYPRARFVLPGSKTEAKLAKQFKKKIKNSIDLTNQTSVLELAALIPKMRLVITPDTGVLHVACAMEATLIALFGPTHVEKTGPYPPTANKRVLLVDSLAKLTPLDVLAAVKKMLTHDH